MKFVIVILLLSIVSIFSEKDSMTWLCLEFCEESQSQIKYNLNQLKIHSNLFTRVSFEKYTLGANSTLIDNELTEVNSEILSMGFESWPLLSSYPHYPQFMEWMRQVFANPQPFIKSCIEEAQKYSYTGYNLDWEPTDDVKPGDGEDYAAFIDTFAKALHERNLKLTVDIATWSSVWDYDALPLTSADEFISMGSYTSNDNSYMNQLNLMKDTFGVDKAGIGLETVNASNSERLTIDEVAFRFKAIMDMGFSSIGLWKSPIPPGWLPLIEKYMNTPLIESPDSSQKNRKEG